MGIPDDLTTDNEEVFTACYLPVEVLKEMIREKEAKLEEYRGIDEAFQKEKQAHRTTKALLIQEQDYRREELEAIDVKIRTAERRAYEAEEEHKQSQIELEQLKKELDAVEAANVAVNRELEEYKRKISMRDEHVQLVLESHEVYVNAEKEQHTALLIEDQELHHINEIHEENVSFEIYELIEQLSEENQQLKKQIAEKDNKLLGHCDSFRYDDDNSGDASHVCDASEQPSECLASFFNIDDLPPVDSSELLDVNAILDNSSASEGYGTSEDDHSSGNDSVDDLSPQFAEIRKEVLPKSFEMYSSQKEVELEPLKLYAKHNERKNVELMDTVKKLKIQNEELINSINRLPKVAVEESPIQSIKELPKPSLGTSGIEIFIAYIFIILCIYIGLAVKLDFPIFFFLSSDTFSVKNIAYGPSPM